MPLNGMRVVDLTRIIAGPFCTLMLGDLGAEVIKIEPPKEGDPLRAQGVIKDGLSWYYASYNRNKKSLSLDLYSTEGKEILSDLIKTSDVVVENFRPGVMDKMGFGYSRLKQLKSDIIYCGITGFGKSGPYKDRPAFDFIAQAMSGFMSVNGNEGEEPLRAGIPISDLVAGLYAAFGIVSALLHRARTGEGQEVQTSLVDGLISMLSYMAANYLASGKPPVRTGNDHPLVAPYGIFRCSDGEVAIAPSNDQVYFKLLSALGLDHLKEVPGFASNDLRMTNRKQIKTVIQEVISKKPKSYWIEYLNKAGVPCGTAMSLSEVFEDEQVRHQEMVMEVPHPAHGAVKMAGFPVKLSATPCRVQHPAPELGQHTDEILKKLGMSRERIADLRHCGIV
ncbi:MAG: CoA transferase [Deltaproteobacteria bacterium]|nr:CoA transferase [Deltaproteobacteria bacterium]